MEGAVIAVLVFALFVVVFFLLYRLYYAIYQFWYRRTNGHKEPDDG